MKKLLKPHGKNCLEKQGSMIALPFRAESQFAGVRPAGKDRKAMVGLHDLHKNVAIFNGAGGRGVLLSPFFAQLLADHMESGASIPLEIDFARFAMRNSAPGRASRRR